MALLDTTLDAMLSGALSFTTDVVRMSLHSADPTTLGDNETTAARLTVSWTVPATGSTSLLGTYTFSGGAAGGDCTHVGLWSADDSTFYGGFALTGATTFDANGQYVVDAGDIDGSSTG